MATTTLPKPLAAQYLGRSTRWLEIAESNGEIHHTEKIGRHRALRSVGSRQAQA